MNKNIILLIIIVILIGLVGYLILAKKPETPQSQQPTTTTTTTTTTPSTQETTADWKTYRNEAFGFKFKYPAEIKAVSSGPNEEQKKLDRGEMTSGTMKPSYDTITFYNPANKKQFDVTIFPVRKDNISSAGFKGGYLSLGSVCDTRWINSISSEPVLLNKNGIPVLEAQVISGGPRGGSNAGCYYFKNSKGNLIVFNVSGFEQKSDFLNVFHLVGDKILPTLRLLK